MNELARFLPHNLKKIKPEVENKNCFWKVNLGQGEYVTGVQSGDTERLKQLFRMCFQKCILLILAFYLLSFRQDFPTWKVYGRALISNYSPPC